MSSSDRKMFEKWTGVFSAVGNINSLLVLLGIFLSDLIPKPEGEEGACISFTTLKEGLRLKSNTLSSTLKKLKEANLIKKMNNPNPDAKRHSVYTLTEEGLNFVRDLQLDEMLAKEFLEYYGI